MLQCEPLPCFNQATTLDLKKTGPGAFRLINIDGSHGGTNGGTLADWMLNGYGGYMPLDWYYSDPGAKFNSSAMQNALTQSTASKLLFPVYRGTRGHGSNFEYEIVGWVGFHMTGFDAGEVGNSLWLVHEHHLGRNPGRARHRRRLRRSHDLAHQLERSPIHDETS